MSKFQIEQVLHCLRYGSPSSKLDAMDTYLSIPSNSVSTSDQRKVLEAALKAMEDTTNGPFVAERLLRFGQLAEQTLIEFMAHTTKPEARVLAALILLNKGYRVGVPVLVQEVEKEGSYRSLASNTLANAGISAHVPAILNRIRNYSTPCLGEFPTTADDEILNLIDTLKRLQVELPEDIKTKFSGPTVPQFFQDAVASSPDKPRG